jgi:hypothetical protein
MLALFIAVFIASVTFILAFLLKLPEDSKNRSIRPLFFLLFSIGFWVATLPAMLSPESPVLVSYPAYNVISDSSTFQYPLTVTNVTSIISVRSYNAYFYVWLIILTFLLFITLIWYVDRLRQKTQQAMHEGADVMKQFDKHYGS